MFDFVCICFHDEIEISLLKVQLHSFKFVDPHIVNNIFILFNDTSSKIPWFMEKYNQLIQFCPSILQEKLHIIFVTDLIDLTEKTYQSDWYTQQFAKLYVCKVIKSEYYVVLDAKNTFIKNVTIDTFIDNNKIKMYHETHGYDMPTYYYNCFAYFNINCPDTYNPYASQYKIQTTTPFVFVTKECIELITYVEQKENVEFYDFFINSKKFTEFFFYFAWLCFRNKHHDKYTYINRYIDNVIIGPFDPKIFIWNSWDSKKTQLTISNPSVFSLNRKSLGFIDKDYKHSVKLFYASTYNDTDINDLISTFLDS